MNTDTAGLKVSVEKPTAWGRRLTITVPSERVEREKASAAQRLAKNVRLPGFRKGRIPTQVMEKRFGPAIEQEAVEKAIGAAYRDALEQEGLKPITQGSIDHFHYEPGTDLTFHVELEVRPELELDILGGFTVRRESAAASDEQVDQVLQRLREEHATWQVADAVTATQGDLVDVEITPLDDAMEAEPKPRRYQIVIGEGQAVPAIEDVLRTLRAGEEGEFTVDLPENAEQPDAGVKPHRIHVRMLDVKQPEYPALDDEFAKRVGDFESMAVLRERVREDLGKEAERESERRVRTQLLEEIINANPFDVPQTMVQQYLEAMLPARDGADPERVKQVQQDARPVAEQALKRMLVIERVAELEGLHASPAEVSARIEELAARLNRPEREVTAQLRKNGRLDEIEREITEDRVFTYLKSLSTIA